MELIASNTVDTRHGNVNSATISHGHIELLEALNRHRGKGQQKVTVEHSDGYSVGKRGSVPDNGAATIR